MKNQRKKSLITGSFIAFLIVAAPYLLYIHESIPEDTIDFQTFLGTIKGNFFGNAQNYVYFLFAKFVPLLLLMIWFVTNKHWWVHALAIPISVYLFQLISVINDTEEFFARVEFIYTVPITALILVILYYLRNKLAIFVLALDLKKEMDENMNKPKKSNQ